VGFFSLKGRKKNAFGGRAKKGRFGVHINWRDKGRKTYYFLTVKSRSNFLERAVASKNLLGVYTFLV
jgi:hypothetical protein